MSRTRVRRRRTVLVAAVALFGGLWAGPIAHADDVRPVAPHRYVVRAGDTVWDIADRFSNGADPRPLMDAIDSANALDAGALRPGQILVIPSV